MSSVCPVTVITCHNNGLTATWQMSTCQLFLSVLNPLICYNGWSHIVPAIWAVYLLVCVWWPAHLYLLSYSLAVIRCYTRQSTFYFSTEEYINVYKLISLTKWSHILSLFDVDASTSWIIRRIKTYQQPLPYFGWLRTSILILYT